MKCPVVDFTFLPDQLVKPTLLDCAIALPVDVRSVIALRRSPIEQHAEANGSAILPGPKIQFMTSDS